MTLSYYILIPAIVEINEFLNKKKLFSLLIFALSSIIIISFGSRGALLCLIIYVFLRFYIYTKNKNLKIVFLKLFLALLIIFGILNINGIIVFLNNMLISIGINSRTLYLFLNNFDHLSGRNEIYELILGYISKQSLFGSGIGYDRVLLNGAYSHNLFLEMIINFGLIVGVLMFVILFIMTIFASVRDIANKDNLITILIILGLVYLTFSGSYLTDITFWIFLGFTFSNIFRKNRRKYETNY
jgi:O-antigen ligase